MTFRDPFHRLSYSFLECASFNERVMPASFGGSDSIDTRRFGLFLQKGH